MEPTTGLLIGAGSAAAGWLIGRVSSQRAGAPTPGDAITETGTRVARQAANTVALVGTRAALLSAAGVSITGSAVARTLGATVSTSYGAARALLHRGDAERDGEPIVDAPVEDGLPTTERTASGLDVPVDADLY